MFKTYHVFLNELLFVADGLMTILSMWFAWNLKFNSKLISHAAHDPFQTYVPIMLFGMAAFWLAGVISGLYRTTQVRAVWGYALNAFKAAVLGLLLFMSALYFGGFVHFSREVLAIFVVTYICSVVGVRIVLLMVLRIIRRRNNNQKIILLVGHNSSVDKLIDELENHPVFGYRILGYLSTGNDQQISVPCLGTTDVLHVILQKNFIDHVVIALSREDILATNQITAVCDSLGVQSLILPDFLDVLPAKPRFESISGLPLIDTRYVPLDDAINAAIKRTFDLLCGTLGLIVLFPLFGLIALCVRLSSPGPIFFVQERVGKNKKTFKMYKFRSMSYDPSVNTGGWTVANDPRRTKFGSFLRRTSLDELPQFWNVIKGDMSIIGPRPERPEFVDKFRKDIPKYMVKHRVRPGITGWAQVNGWRGDTSISSRVEHDLYYIENWTFIFDVKIFIMTIFKGMSGAGAY
ncbi:undecaprenyl-phosphate glucose phosphotransferase [Alicyclobacillus dauci]|uniref:Undecaprenyl-phosphate glucose phosphotransferase n=1 Tax=Alicyclobacillus dauci TaxID=1475485 RepID=A0ABY6Z1R7_9BACL|nr:undecaprenyl-phosphate glucose phosphotransferase [Alicyclobacillus dauci]WAH36829.1 undecaprenyl-phosphate glucose phosphotransferase [Alicyclobacillus dauci]